MNEINTNKSLNGKLYIKQEIFDHLVYPLSIKLDNNMIIQLFRKLHIISSYDYKITLEEWIQQSTTFLNGFTEKEAIILFNTYKIVSQEFEKCNVGIYSNSISKSNKTNNKNSVDVTYFALFFALQCYIQKNKSSSIDTLDKNAYGNSSINNSFPNSTNNNNNSNDSSNYINNYNCNNNYSYSPMASPRGSKQNSLIKNNINSSINDICSMYSFVKNNLKLFLQLIATDIHNTETLLNSKEFNALKFFFDFQENEKSNNNQNSITYTSNNNYSLNKPGLAGIAPFFNNFSTTMKVSIDKIIDWMINNIYSIDKININNSFNLQHIDSNTIIFKNLNKSLLVKDQFDNKNVKILYCEESKIYINSCVKNIKISNCSNCVIFVAVSSKFFTIEKCENVTVCVATNFTKIGHCIDCTINCFSLEKPILYGDNKGLKLGPYNVYYENLKNLFKINEFTNNITRIEDSYIRNSLNPILMHHSHLEDNTNTSINTNYNSNYKSNTNKKLAYEIIQPFDFYELITPFNKSKFNYEINNKSQLIKNFNLTPLEYVEILYNRMLNYSQIKEKIKSSLFDDNQEKLVHEGIQGYFREWLVSTGKLKNISELVKEMELADGGNNTNI